MKTITMRFEPSKRLSEILGFPYFIEKRLTLEEMTALNLSSDDWERMEVGEEIKHRVKLGKRK